MALPTEERGTEGAEILPTNLEAPQQPLCHMPSLTTTLFATSLDGLRRLGLGGKLRQQQREYWEEPWPGVEMGWVFLLCLTHSNNLVLDSCPLSGLKQMSFVNQDSWTGGYG